MTDDERLAILRRHVDELSEHYDAVQIVGSWLAQDGTTHCHKRGSGNWYARIQMSRQFVQEDIAEDQAKAIAREIDPPDDWKQSQEP